MLVTLFNILPIEELRTEHILPVSQFSELSPLINRERYHCYQEGLFVGIATESLVTTFVTTCYLVTLFAVSSTL